MDYEQFIENSIKRVGNFQVLDEEACRGLISYALKNVGFSNIIERLQTKKIIFIRHAQSELNAYHSRFWWKLFVPYPNQLEFYDPKLTLKGFDQCRIATKKLEEDLDIPEIDIAFVSPLERTLQTYKGISLCSKLTRIREVIVTQLIRESSNTMAGQVGKQTSILRKMYPAFNFDFINHEKWWRNFSYELNSNQNEVETYKRETNQSVQARVALLIIYLALRKETNILLVGHGIIIEVFENFPYISTFSKPYKNIQNKKIANTRYQKSRN